MEAVLSRAEPRSISPGRVKNARSISSMGIQAAALWFLLQSLFMQ